MDHRDHVNLISGGVPATGGVWADFGAGEGAFTLALRELFGQDAQIYAIDRDTRALESLQHAMERRFPGTVVHGVESDFRQPLELPPLDGIVAANALHFVTRAEQVPVLASWRRYLSPEGRLILVEYDADDGNRWVPHPISFRRLATLAEAAGFAPPERLAERPTRILRRMYSALLRNVSI